MTQLITAHCDLLRLGVEGVLSLVAELPPWRRSLDDDPVWVRPVSAVGLSRDLTPLRPRADVGRDLAAGRGRRARVPLTAITAAGQPSVRLDAVAHYLTSPTVLFDPDPWWGHPLPVLFARSDGTCRVMDGTNRTAAAAIRQDSHLEVVLLTAADLVTEPN